MEEAARLLQTTPRTIYRMVGDGRLAAVALRDGRAVLRASIDRLLADDAVTQADAAKLLGLDARSIRRMLAEGRLEPASTPTGRRGVTRASLEAATDKVGRVNLGRQTRTSDKTGRARLANDRRHAAVRPGDDAFVPLRSTPEVMLATRPPRPRRRMRLRTLSLAVLGFAASVLAGVVLAGHDTPSATPKAVSASVTPVATSGQSPTLSRPGPSFPSADVTTLGRPAPPRVVSVRGDKADAPPVRKPKPRNVGRTTKGRTSVARAEPASAVADPAIAECVAIYGGKGLCG